MTPRSTRLRATVAGAAALTMLTAACASTDSGDGAASSAPVATAAPSTESAPSADAAPPATATPADSTPGAEATTPAAPPDTAPAATDAPAAVPEALQFSGPLVGGGELDAASTAGTPTVFWFWAPT